MIDVFNPKSAESAEASIAWYMLKLQNGNTPYVYKRGLY